MCDQNRNLVHNAAFQVLIVSSSFVFSGCIYPGTIYADGWLSRPVIVTVTDANTDLAVSGATVRLRASDDMQRFLETTEEKKYEEVTGIGGTAELLVWFGFGSKRTLWFTEGGFSLNDAGTLEVNAEGYKPLECEFALLTGEHSRSVNDKSPVEISVKLIPSN